MRLTVVGCSGSYPGPDSPASCYLVEARRRGPHLAALLDLGPGRSARCSATPTRSPSTRCSSATSTPTTALDLCGYYVVRSYHPDGAAAACRCGARRGPPSGWPRRYGLPADPGMTDEFDFRELRRRRSPSARSRSSRRRSSTPSGPTGSGCEAGGATLAYSGDTGPCDGLDELAPGADLLLAEASFRSGEDNPPDLHLTGADCGRAAAGRRRDGWCSPTSRHGSTRRWRSPRPRSSSRATSARHRRGGLRRVANLPGSSHA